MGEWRNCRRRSIKCLVKGVASKRRGCAEHCKRLRAGVMRKTAMRASAGLLNKAAPRPKCPGGLGASALSCALRRQPSTHNSQPANQLESFLNPN